MNNELTLKEAAEHLGINLQALRQRIRRRHLSLNQRQGPNGPFYVMTGDDIETLKEAPSSATVACTNRVYVQATVEKTSEPYTVSSRDALIFQANAGEDYVSSTSETVTDGLRTVYVPCTTDELSSAYTLNVHPSVTGDVKSSEEKAFVDCTDTVNTPSTKENELAHTLAEVANKTLDQNRELEKKLEQMHLTLFETLEQKARAERQSMSLANELSSYRRALSEQAESLVQERAQRLSLEHQLTDSMNNPSLKLDTPTPSKGQGWGSRMRRWLAIKVG